MSPLGSSLIMQQQAVKSAVCCERLNLCTRKELVDSSAKVTGKPFVSEIQLPKDLRLIFSCLKVQSGEISLL